MLRHCDLPVCFLSMNIPRTHKTQTLHTKLKLYTKNESPFSFTISIFVKFLSTSMNLICLIKGSTSLISDLFKFRIFWSISCIFACKSKRFCAENVMQQLWFGMIFAICASNARIMYLAGGSFQCVCLFKPVHIMLNSCRKSSDIPILWSLL